MRKIQKTVLAALAALLAMSAGAQQVNTLYFLENSPMRHTINPAFQPVSQGYLNFTPIGWMSYGMGNNSLTMSDIFFVDPTTGKTITPLHPNADRNAFLKQISQVTMINNDGSVGLINLGFRVKDKKKGTNKGYLMLGANIRYNTGVTIPKSVFNYAMSGFMTDITGTNKLSLGGIGAGAMMYSEVSGGYSYRINDKWTVGGKLKALFGHVYAGINTNDFAIDASSEEWRIHGTIGADVAAPVNIEYLNQYVINKNINEIINGFKDGTFNRDRLIYLPDWPSLLVPAGYGAALDLGFTWKPIQNLQVSAALVDFGAIYWIKSDRLSCTVDTTFAGAGSIDYGDPAYRDAQGHFSTEILMDTVTTRLMGLLNGVRLSQNSTKGFLRMTCARLNIGLDANFWENRVGVGILSATRLYNARLYEEVTIGAAFRPVNWFNLAVTYSLMNNGKYSNIGAGIGFMPYDGINLTLALDYIPTSYAGTYVNGQKRHILPDKTKMFNLAFGFTICWGSNRPDKDRDGVWDKLDMCPGTPRNVQVDKNGCPKDEDGDGIPDYLDMCPATPDEAIGFLNAQGCPLDTDGDGVHDYMDECPDTPQDAHGYISSSGCPLDSDGDGVPDYLDDCPHTPEEAYIYIDEKGCPKDKDKDGVPDYKDECPDTPLEALSFVDEKGCVSDTDGDGVPDYLDECPLVPGLKETNGCPQVKREVRQLLQKALDGIDFEAGKSTIKASSFPLLDQIASIFLENENYIIEVQGHTDNSGKPEVNKALSQKRAEAVKEYFVKKGVSAERMTAIGYGDERPIADNSTKAGRAKNRRVEFNVTFEEIHEEIITDFTGKKTE